ncbi:hypothetical protein Enr17x_51640 [Gimesia fumaroli]|uniref:Uncharacterized protein n=1 Tax=Gimesia fumaroli TaxID=2527976 RepID=A0A518IJ18_9PLAN|nr:hypothetical protein Enr17x_51640 [Gimesia fumaroli]
MITNFNFRRIPTLLFMLIMVVSILDEGFTEEATAQKNPTDSTEKSPPVSKMTIRNAIQSAIAERDMVTSGDLSLDIETTSPRGIDLYGYRIKFDENSARVTHISPYPSDSRKGVFQRTFITGKDRAYTYSDEELLNKDSVMVLQVDKRKMDRDIFVGLPNPQKLGMFPLHTNAYSVFERDFFLKCLDREDLKASWVDLNGTECLLCEYQLAERHSNVRMWLNPVYNFSIVKITLSEFYDDDIDVIQKVDVSYQKIKASYKNKKTDIWFPASVHFERLENGIPQTVESVKVVVHSLNAGIDQRELEIPSLNVPEGTPVSLVLDSPDQNEYVWKDGKISKININDMVSSHLSAVSRRTQNARAFYILITVNLLLLGIIILYFYFRKKKPEIK